MAGQLEAYQLVPSADGDPSKNEYKLQVQYSSHDGVVKLAPFDDMEIDLAELFAP